MKVISYVLCGLLGAAVGVAAGMQITKKKLTEKHEKEIASIKATRADHDEWLLKQYGIVRSKKPDSDNKNSQSKPQVAKMTDLRSSDIKDYHSAVAGYAVQGEAPKLNNRDIVLISDEEYNESTNSYQTLHFFAGDGVVADADDNRIPNFEKMIGSITVWCKFKDEQPVYVRNNITGIDYEIVYRKEKWYDVATPTQRTQAMNV